MQLTTQQIELCKEVADTMDMETDEVQEYLIWDFIDDGEDIPNHDDFVGHIEWQEQISTVMHNADEMGVPFDHLMGAVMGGVCDEAGYGLYR